MLSNSLQKIFRSFITLCSQIVSKSYRNSFMFDRTVEYNSSVGNSDQHEAGIAQSIKNLLTAYYPEIFLKIVLLPAKY